VETEVHREEPDISRHPLSGIPAPQTLKSWGYIKHHKVVVLVDSGNIHNFINKRIAQETDCFASPMSNFQIMILNGGMMKCGGRCVNVHQ